MTKDESTDHLNLTVVALVALVAIVGLVALVMNVAKVPIVTGGRLATAANEDRNVAVDALYRSADEGACLTCLMNKGCGTPRGCSADAISACTYVC